MDEALRQSVFLHVTAAIRRSLSIRDLEMTPATRLSEDLELDSLDVVEVAMSLEETFDVEFPQDAVQRFSAVGDIVAYLSCRFFRDVDERSLHRVA